MMEQSWIDPWYGELGSLHLDVHCAGTTFAVVGYSQMELDAVLGPVCASASASVWQSMLGENGAVHEDHSHYCQRGEPAS